MLVTDILSIQTGDMYILSIHAGDIYTYIFFLALMVTLTKYNQYSAFPDRTITVMFITFYKAFQYFSRE